MISTTIYDRETGESQTLPHFQASQELRMRPDVWSLTPPPPRGWEREIPLYRTTRAVIPPSFARVASDPPWESCSDDSVWQYGSEPLAEGNEIETTSWPHTSFRPLNESAKRIHSFFTTNTKSRMTQSPWRNGAVHLNDGLSHGAIAPLARPKASMKLTSGTGR